MDNRVLSKAAKIAVGGVVLTALVALGYWVRSSVVPQVGNADEGEFLLVEASERELDGAPALTLTFTLPLDARQSYDKYIRVFEMPSSPPKPGERRSFFEEEDRPGTGGTVVSTKPEDTKSDGGTVVSGAWIVGDNPRLLLFPHIKPQTRYVITVASGLAARNTSKLAADWKYSVRTAPMPPSYYFASNGMVLPAGQNGGLPVVTVNVPEVDIQFLRVKNERLPDFLDRVMARRKSNRQAEEDGNDDGDEDRYDYRRTSLHGAVGYYQLDDFRGLVDSVYIGRFTAEARPNRRSVTYIPVEDVRELREPGVYVAVMTQPGRFRYDSQTTYFYISDLGMHLRVFDKGADAFVSSLVDGRAVRSVDISWLDGQGKMLTHAQTDGDGHALFAEWPREAKVVLARKDKQVSLLAMREPALDLSEYDIVGERSTSVRLFAYSGRNLYRPGESLDVSVLVRDADGRPVPVQPIQAILKDPRGRKQFTATWQPDSRYPGYYLKHLTLPEDAATGAWSLELRADPADRSPGTVLRLGVEEFLPERMKLDLTSNDPALTAEQTFNIDVHGTYLYGAPAAGNRLLGVAEFVRNKNPLATKYPGFEFGDSNESDKKSRTELPEQVLDGKGNGQVQLDLAPVASTISPFTARVTLSLLETGGRPVVRSIERVVWPAAVLVGVRPLFTGDYAREGSRPEFEVLRTDRDANLKAATAMPVRLFRENRDYYWRFDDQRGWHSGFTETEELVETSSVTVPAGGRGKLVVPVKYGRYRLEILDRDTNQTLRYRFYAGWSAQNDETQGVRPDRVALNLDKPAYREGETAHLTITPPHQGEALITVDGTRTLWVKRMSISSDTATVDIPLNKEWTRHDLYVSVMVLRPGNAGDLVTPARALGIVHLPLERGERKLNVTLDAPQKIRPDMPVRIKVRAPDAKGQKALVTLSAVDVGILNITRFESPDPHKFFFGKLRYGADQHDVYGRLIEKMQGRKGQLRFGGDNTPSQTKGLPKIVQLVDLFSGPVQMDERGEVDIPLQVPDFNGTLRLMAVVAAADRFGSKDAEMVVAAPLITELNTPRFLSFGDNAVVALDLQNLSGGAQQLKVSVNGGQGLRIHDAERELSLKDQEKRTLRFPVEARAMPGVQAVSVKVAGNGINIERTFGLAIRPPTPQLQFTKRYTVKAGDTVDIQDAALSGLYPNSALAHVILSDKPPIDVRGAVQDLLTYPYGCGEQLTSTSYPHVFIDEEEARRFGLKPFTREQRVEMLERSIAKLGAMQAPNGGFSLWGNASEYEYWLSAYITSFLMDAREQGFTVPDTMYRQAMDFLLRGLQEGVSKLPAGTTPPPRNDEIFRDRDNGRFDVLAYGAYVLARERKAPLATLRQLYDSRGQAQSGLSLVELGIALNLMGDNTRGASTILEGVRKGRGIGYWWYDYGTVLRDAALSYVLLERHRISVEGRENLLSVIAAEMEKNRYYSTQEKMALFLVGRSLAAGSGSWTANLAAGGKPEQVSQKGTYFRAVSAAELGAGIRVSNTSGASLYVELSLSGNPIQQPPARSDEIELSRTIYTPDGRVVSGRSLQTGETVIVHITARSKGGIGNGLIVDRIPAGLEIENLNIVSGEQLGAVQIAGMNPAEVMGNSHIKHVEFRDDRFVAAVRLDPSPRYYPGVNMGTLNLFYRARVVTPGQFIVPPLYAEDMYRPNIFGLVGGNELLTVVEGRQQ
ncbi:MAG: alpha-2-macroglobulin family protein [Acidobacteria bacterium]|nr:MAG: alpha-2-macroglobulin family protein [Acidobacteriota bacterium]